MTRIQIATRYHSDPVSGGGKITAVVRTGEHKGRRKTVSYDHGEVDPHVIAARELAAACGLDVLSVAYAGTHVGGNTYNVSPLAVSA